MRINVKCSWNEAYLWTCVRKSQGCPGICSPRKDSFFTMAQLTVRKILLIVFKYFCGGYTAKETVEASGISMRAIWNYYRDLRSMVSRYMQHSYEEEKLGTEFTKAGMAEVEVRRLFEWDGVSEKVHDFEGSRCHGLAPMTIIGLLDRATREVRVFAMERKQELMPLIHRNVVAGATEVLFAGRKGEVPAGWDEAAAKGYLLRRISAKDVQSEEDAGEDLIRKFWNAMDAEGGFELMRAKRRSAQMVQDYIDYYRWIAKQKTRSEEAAMQEMIKIFKFCYRF